MEEMMSLDRNDSVRLEMQTILKDLILGESDLFWKRFTVFLSINTLMITLVSSGGIVKDFIGEPVAICLSAIGLLINIVWYLITCRSYAYTYYWMAQMRSIEQDLGVVNVFRAGQEYFDQGSTKLNGEKLSLGRSDKRSIVKISKIVPAVFFLVWAGGLFYFIYCFATL
jgi:hypothetical protein